MVKKSAALNRDWCQPDSVAEILGELISRTRHHLMASMLLDFSMVQGLRKN